MSTHNEQSVKNNSIQSKDFHKGSLHMDNQIDEILQISNSFEMDNRIGKNISSIIKIFKQFSNNLYSKNEISKDHLDQFIQCLKFIDTLNLFMSDSAISELYSYLDEIINKISMTNNRNASKDLIFKHIKYTEMSVIYLKKRIFKNLYFGDGKGLAKEIEYNLEQVIKNGKFEHGIFKQLQNLFYVVQGRIEETKRKEIQQKLDEKKILSIKYKKQRFNTYYDDYNDYSDYRNYSNGRYLHDYNDNFYENEDNSYFNYPRERCGYRDNYFTNNNYYKKNIENEEKEIKIAVEIEHKIIPMLESSPDIPKINSFKEENSKGLNSNENTSSDTKMRIKENCNTPIHYNRTIENLPPIVTNLNDDIEIIKSVIPYKNQYNGNNNSHYQRNDCVNYQLANQGNNQVSYPNYLPIKKKIITKKNQKQSGITLVEVIIPNSPAKSKQNMQISGNLMNESTQEIQTLNPETQSEIKTEESKSQEHYSKEKVLSHLSQSAKIEEKTIQSINQTSQDSCNQSIDPQEKQFNNPKYHQGYNQNGYSKNQNYYYNYNPGYYNNNNLNHHHNHSNNQIQNNQNSFYLKNNNNRNETVLNYGNNNNYYLKDSQDNKYYQTKSKHNFVELDELKIQEKQEQNNKKADVKRKENAEIQKRNEENEGMKMDSENMFEKDKQKDIFEKERVQIGAKNEKLICIPKRENNLIDEEEKEEIKTPKKRNMFNEDIDRDHHAKHISEGLVPISKNKDEELTSLNKEPNVLEHGNNSKFNHKDKDVIEEKAKFNLINPTLLALQIKPFSNQTNCLKPSINQRLVISKFESKLHISSVDQISIITSKELMTRKEEEKEKKLEENSSNRKDESCEQISIQQNKDNAHFNEQNAANKYTDSIKTMDPKIVMTRKNKLSEDYDKKNQSQNQYQFPAYVNYMASFPNGNSQMFHPGLLCMMAYYQRQMINNKIPMQTYIFNQYSQFLYQGRDSNIHKEYIALKTQELENSNIIWQNIINFENKILIPIYQTINYDVSKKRKAYYQTFAKYKKLIQEVLTKDDILEKVKPFGSYINNFLIDNGDIDICIVPKGKILEFSTYLDRIKKEIVENNIGEHKLSHHTRSYLLLKVVDNQTKFNIDITVQTMLPILNTNLVRLYSLYDQRFHILGLYIKHWAKINKIHGAADNYLSSYALLLMLIHFLQKIVEPKVLPNLQRIEEKEVLYEYNNNDEVISTNIYYEEDLNKIKAYMTKINNGLENKETATNLLVKFFEYYSYYFESDKKVSINKENNELVKKSSDMIAFNIEDPFDSQHNPGKSMCLNSHQCNKFMASMKKEINYILNGEYVKRIDKTCLNSNSE